jgi:uncharacterized protein with NRDE domain
VCLVVLAWRVAPAHRLVLAGNRDEAHARPTAPMDWWHEPRLLAGRDLEAGGTWLGVDERGRFGVVTNFRGGHVAANGPSRGGLIPAYLAGTTGPCAFLESLAPEAARYTGFSLLLGDPTELAYFSNCDPSGPRRLPAGIYGLSNGTLDAPWPKVMVSRARLTALLAPPPPPVAALLGLLADQTPAADALLPDTGVGLEIERRLSPAFIVGPTYGTRCSTALLIAADCATTAVEHSYGADGRPLVTRRFDFQAAASPSPP